jgi:hypothetical protein
MTSEVRCPTEACISHNDFEIRHIVKEIAPNLQSSLNGHHKCCCTRPQTVNVDAVGSTYLLFRIRLIVTGKLLLESHKSAVGRKRS